MLYLCFRRNTRLPLEVSTFIVTSSGGEFAWFRAQRNQRHEVSATLHRATFLPIACHGHQDHALAETHTLIVILLSSSASVIPQPMNGSSEKLSQHTLADSALMYVILLLFRSTFALQGSHRGVIQELIRIQAQAQTSPTRVVLIDGPHFSHVERSHLFVCSFGHSASAVSSIHRRTSQ